jgi:hypothetical protein
VKRSAARGLPVIAGLILIGLFCCTVSADSNATVSSPNGIATRQAHLAWAALEKETEMKTAVTYVTTLFGTDTTNMSADLTAFRGEETRIPAAASDADLAGLISDMKNTTALFRDDLSTQMIIGQGKWYDLGLQIGSATANNPYITSRQNAYWNTRSTGTLADFDAWVANSQEVLDNLSANGYDTTAAQRTLDKISISRRDVQSALGTRSESSVASTGQQLLSQTQGFSGQVTAAQGQVPAGVQEQFFIDQGYRAVERADTVNYDLTMILIDIGPADPALSKTKNDLASSRKVLNTDNFGATRTPLRLVRQDLTDLSQAYRDVAHSSDLPPSLTAELNSMVLRLDNTSDQMGAVL